MLVPPLLAFLAPLNEAVLLLWIAILSYGAHTFLTVVQETAAGCDEVAWHSDPWTERLAAFFHLTALAAVWLGPVFFLSWGDVLPLSTSTLVLIVAGYLWLIFPVSLLSSLSAPSRLVILRPRVVLYLLRHFPSLLGYYLATAVVLSVSLSVFGLAVAVARLDPPEVPEIDLLSVLYQWTLRVGLILLLPFAAVVAAVGLLIYARLVGRLGLLLHLAWKAEEQLAEEQEAAAVPPSPPRPEAAEPPAEAFTPATDAEVYPLLAEDQTVALQAAPTTRRADDVFTALPPDAAGRQKAALLMEQTAPSRLELRLARSESAPRLPRWPLFSGVYSFPFYRSNVRQLTTLALGNLVVGVVLYLLVGWLSR